MPDQTQQTSLVIADIHLQPNQLQHPINQTFLRFLQQKAIHAQRLYILGDLFEVWLGDDIGLQQYPTEIQALKELSNSGTELYLQYGNRDFLMRKRFQQASGVHLLADEYTLTIGDREVLILHGDQLCTDDIDYQKMRRIFRNPIIQWLFLHLPKSKRIKIGEKMRQESIQAGKTKNAEIMDITEEALQALLQRHPGCTTVIHGHTHKPAQHTHHFNGQDYQRYVLSDWRPATQYLSLTADGIETHEFE
ncbi:UDP-2,3-diacylglucosamine diphosphatase [Thiomicrorhabdus xiamenensis]|uniref:UDP-2,3-diacylglucosamine hydrolase n=1 Tax=Thiomicrorhabdus xiamenensis TaxID=2739063 RepID=A0A7D4NYU7_9GAMM|nr:UDP-2,3-diacylglucosamine diphosphatase [Thiomicrorhabdus xiamenensis]QKI89378.1 UDP-2,3-diacylglucosamine diphosphatase [Thiomicrorhabdus xiamenensis]